jgi:hypothetical protein
MLYLLNSTINKACHAGPSFVTPGLLFRRVVRCQLQLAQNRAVRLALGCTQRANINDMHVNPSWLKVEERLTSSLLVLVRGIDMLKVPSCLFLAAGAELGHQCIPHKTCHQRSLHSTT